MNIAHFYLKRRYMYLLDILPLAVSIGEFSLALSYANSRNNKVTFVCSFGFSRKRIIRPVRQPRSSAMLAIMGEFSSWEEETPSAHS